MIPAPAIPAACCAAECIAFARRRHELGLEVQARLQSLGTWAGAGKCSGLVHGSPSCPGKCPGPGSAMAVKLLGCAWALPIHHRTTRAGFVLTLTAAQQALCWDHPVHKGSSCGSEVFLVCDRPWGHSHNSILLGKLWVRTSNKACYQCRSMRSSRADFRHTTQALAFTPTTCNNQLC